MEISNVSRTYKPAIYIPQNCNLTKEEIEKQYNEKYDLRPYVCIIVIENKQPENN